MEDIFDADGTALQAALDLIEVIIKTDPDVYDDLDRKSTRLNSSHRT